MSLRVIHLVHNSRIEPQLRFLAVTLALFADDDGGEIYPGVQRLTQALGVGTRAVLKSLKALVKSQVIVRDGLHGHTRRYRFDLERLAQYTPRPYAVAKGSNRKPNRERVNHSSPLAPPERVHHSSRNGEPQGTERVNHSSRKGEPQFAPIRKESQDSQDSQERTGADAPACSHEEAMTEELRAKYLALARLAIADANGNRDDSLPTITKYFKRRCAEQGLRHDSQIVSAAIAEALAAREAAKQQWVNQLESTARGRRMP